MANIKFIRLENINASAWLVGSVISVIFFIVKMDPNSPLDIFKPNFLVWLLVHAATAFYIGGEFHNAVYYNWFFFALTRMWHKLIGYEMWLNFTNPLREWNLNGLCRSRFNFYSQLMLVVNIVTWTSSWLFRGAMPWTDVALNSEMESELNVMTILSIIGAVVVASKFFVICGEVSEIKRVRLYRPISILLTLWWTVYMMDLPWIAFHLLFAYFKQLYVIGFFYMYLLVEGTLMRKIFVRPLWKVIQANTNNRAR